MQFIKQSEFNINNYQGYNEVPFQHSHYMIPQAKDCMEAKYMLLEANPEMWRTLSFTRNKTKEEQLKKY